MPKNIPSLKPRELVRILESAGVSIARVKATIACTFVTLVDTSALSPLICARVNYRRFTSCVSFGNLVLPIKKSKTFLTDNQPCPPTSTLLPIARPPSAVQRRSCSSVRIAFFDVELSAYTQDKLNRMLATRAGFLQTILREMIPLRGDRRIWRALRAG
mgnify:CR=1 FL=1